MTSGGLRIRGRSRDAVGAGETTGVYVALEPRNARPDGGVEEVAAIRLHHRRVRVAVLPHVLERPSGGGTVELHDTARAYVHGLPIRRDGHGLRLAQGGPGLLARQRGARTGTVDGRFAGDASLVGKRTRARIASERAERRVVLARDIDRVAIGAYAQSVRVVQPGVLAVIRRARNRRARTRTRGPACRLARDAAPVSQRSGPRIAIKGDHGVIRLGREVKGGALRIEDDGAGIVEARLVPGGCGARGQRAGPRAARTQLLVAGDAPVVGERTRPGVAMERRQHVAPIAAAPVVVVVEHAGPVRGRIEEGAVGAHRK